MKTTTAIAVSGGIDSLAAAWLLKQQGHNVIGIHFITGFESSATGLERAVEIPMDSAHVDASAVPDSAAFRSASQEMALIAAQLDIPIKLIDCRKAFRARVVDYFTRTYLNGYTPNPCLVCNPNIKFGFILDAARRLGATRLATGHYARVEKDRQGRYHLLKGVDPLKDQSYFLGFLTQKQLAAACFPLGGMHKSEVKALAAAKGLVPVSQNESQDICFIKGTHYADFILNQTGVKPEAGLIEDVGGNVIGKHQGLHRFTIGQRRGINCPAAEPYYVVRIDMKRNRLVVGFKKDVYATECRVKRINWISAAPSTPLEVHTRLRYGQREVAATLIPAEDNRAVIRFKEPQASITPGQGAVFYQGNEVLGTGWIDI